MTNPEILAKELGLTSVGGAPAASAELGDDGATGESPTPAAEGEEPLSSESRTELEGDQPESSTGKKGGGKSRDAQSRIKELNRRAKEAEAGQDDLRSLVAELTQKIEKLSTPRDDTVMAEALAGEGELKLTPEQRLRFARVVAENEVLRDYPGLPEAVMKTAIDRRVAFQAKGMPFSLKECVASAMALHDYTPDNSQDGEGGEMDDQQPRGSVPPRSRSMTTGGPGGRGSSKPTAEDPKVTAEKQRQEKLASITTLLRNPRLNQKDRRTLVVEKMKLMGY